MGMAETNRKMQPEFAELAASRPEEAFKVLLLVRCSKLSSEHEQ